MKKKSVLLWLCMVYTCTTAWAVSTTWLPQTGHTLYPLTVFSLQETYAKTNWAASPLSPVLLSPVPNQPTEHRYVILFKVSTNDPRAKSCQIEVFSESTGNKVPIHLSPKGIANGIFSADGTFSALDMPEGKYWVVITNMGTTPVEVYERSAFSIQVLLAMPRLLSPQPNTIVSIPSKLLFLSIDHNNANSLRVRIWATAPRKQIFEKYYPFKHQNTGLLEDVVYIPDIQENERYLLEITTYNFPDVPIGFKYFPFFTGTQTPIGKAPEMQFLTGTNVLYLCGHYRGWNANSTIQVKATDPATTKLRIHAFTPDANGTEILRRIYVAPFNALYDKWEIPVSPSQINQFQNYILFTPYSMPANVYFRITAIDKDGQILNTTAVPANVTLTPYNTVVEPVVLNPLPEQTNVPIWPWLGVSLIKGHCQYVKVEYFELDTYPADWAGTDYQKSTQLLGSDAVGYFWIPTTLKPNTTYEWAIRFRNPNTDFGGYINRKIVRFTTSATGAAPLRLNPSDGSTTSITRSLAKPNPFHQDLEIQISDAFTNAQVRMVNQAGKVVWSGQTAGGQKLSLQTERLPAGVYVIHLIDSQGKAEQFKVIKQ